MAADIGFDDMADACIKAAEHVQRSGSPELQAVMRVVLHILAGEIARQAEDAITTLRRSDDGGQPH